MLHHRDLIELDAITVNSDASDEDRSVHLWHFCNTKTLLRGSTVVENIAMLKSMKKW